jgi:hypothetical protein
MTQAIKKQNVTVSLTPQTIQKAKVLAAKRSTSISGLLAQQIDVLVGAEEAYEQAERAALALLEKGGTLSTAMPSGVLTPQLTTFQWHSGSRMRPESVFGMPSFWRPRGRLEQPESSRRP